MVLERFIPLAALERLEQGILVSDELGVVKTCNRAAGSLLGYDSEAAVGMHCWKVARLQTFGGEPHCGRDCPIQRSMRDGAFHPCAHLRRPNHDGPSVGIHLYTLPIPPAREGRHAVIHMLTPENGHALSTLEGAEKGLGTLSKREEEVLDLMAAGLETDEIAGRLAICPTTVRNHVQRILEKLSVHKRLPAVLIWMLRRH